MNPQDDDLRYVNCRYLRNHNKKNETEQIYKPCGLATYEITTFENIDVGVTLPLKVTRPWKRKLSVISESVTDRSKWSYFSNPEGLLPSKIQILKISIFEVT